MTLSMATSHLAAWFGGLLCHFMIMSMAILLNLFLSGRGEINGTPISAMDEFLIVPDAVVNITAFEQLIIYVFYPIPVIHTGADACS